jgi:flagellar P-ring protein precursor FlgI
MLMDGASIGDLVKALNSIGATPRDIIAILQAVEKAGALHGKLEIM